MRKIVRELHKQFPGVEIEVTGHKHYRLRFPGGLIITTSGTPSDWRARLNLRALVRRKLNHRAGRTLGKSAPPVAGCFSEMPSLL